MHLASRIAIVGFAGASWWPVSAGAPMVAARASQPEARPFVVFTNATLFDGLSGDIRRGVTIVLANGRVAELRTSRGRQVPRGAEVYDLRGQMVMPGFIDMHYHVTTGAMRYRRDRSGALDSTYDRRLAERLLRVALAHGITTIRDPGASPLAPALELRNAVAQGRVLGPRIFTAGPIITNPKLSEEDIREEVRRQARAGVDYIKLYAGIGPGPLRAAVDQAHRLEIKVIGHLQRTSWTEAARAGIDYLTHAGNWHELYLHSSRRSAYAALDGGMRARIAWLEGLEVNGAAVDTLIRTLKHSRVSIDPTLVAYHTKFWWRDSIYQQDPDHALVPEVLENWQVLGMPTSDWAPGEFDRVQAAWPRLLALVRRLHEAGIALTVGSDLASPWVIPGGGFHQELALLESAGISGADVLQLATRNGAEALGIDGETGTVAVGKRADLVVLAGNPLDEMSATRAIRYVVLGGMVYRPSDLLDSRPSQW